MQDNDKIVTLVSALDEAGMFVVYAARIHRAGRQPRAGRHECLCRLFHAAGMCGAQALFVDLQDALIADPVAGFIAANRGAPTVNRQEMRLLAALAHWQRHPRDLSDHALETLAPPTSRRIAAPMAREFAAEMTVAGLWLGMGLPEIEVLAGDVPPLEYAQLMH